MLDWFMNSYDHHITWLNRLNLQPMLCPNDVIIIYKDLYFYLYFYFDMKDLYFLILYIYILLDEENHAINKGQ